MKISGNSLLFALAVSAAGCNSAAAGPDLPPPAEDSGPAAPQLPELEALKPPPAKAIESRYIGSTYADERVEVASDRGGILASVFFDEGDEVKKGDVVFRLKSQTEKLNLSASRKQLSAAKTGLKTARREHARIKELFDAGAATPASLDAVESQVEQAEISVEQAQVAVEMGQSGVGDMRTRSPIDGVVVERRHEPGEAVVTVPPTVVIVVENHATLELRFRVPELDLRDIRKGTHLQAYFPALDESRDVTVSRIGSAVDVKTRSIEIIAKVDNPDLRLKPGMSTEVRPKRAESNEPQDDAETKTDEPAKVATGAAK